MKKIINTSVSDLVRTISKELANSDRFSQANLQTIIKHITRSDNAHLIHRSIDIEEDLYENTLSKIKSGVPIEYIINYTDFLDHRLYIEPDLLIPRLETEYCLDIILKRFEIKSKTFVEFGCGSGCISTHVIKKIKPNRSFLIDPNPIALKVTKCNLNNNTYNTSFSSNSRLLPRINDNYFIISNPPYLNEEMYKDLDDSVKSFESEEALLAGKDGLDVYKEIIQFIESNKLNKLELLCLEIDPVILKPLLIILQPILPSRELEIIKDQYGIDRFIVVS